MSEPEKAPTPDLRDELLEALALLRATPAGDVPGMSYGEALGRAAHKLHDRSTPSIVRPTRIP